jgi:glucan-binding YG repeat protein
MVSSNKYFTTTTGEDVDLGIKVDAELVRITGEGEIDLTGFYNIPALGVLMNEFYGVYTSEWVDGVWYDKNHQMTYAGIGQWVKSKEGKWTYVDTLGWSPKNQWQKIDGKWYFFDKEGVMETKAYRQGYYLMANGAWDGKTKAAGWKQDSKGWWYSLGGSDFLKNGWKKIDGNWYYFKANGYIAVNEFVQGWWVGRNGVQSDPVKYGWHKSGSKWWYGVKDGWYAKSKSYIIDGKTYAFDKDGYTK